MLAVDKTSVISLGLLLILSIWEFKYELAMQLFFSVLTVPAFNLNNKP